MNELSKAGLFDTTLITVSAKTVIENISGSEVTDRDVIKSIAEPHSATGGIAVLFGSLAPNGSVVKRSAVSTEMQCHKGPARVFEM